MNRYFNLLKLLICFLVFNFNANAHEIKIVGYYANWAIYRNPTFYPKDINPHLVTHINYAFIKLDPSGNLVLFDPWADVQYGEKWNESRPYWGNFKQLAELKQKNPQLKILASVGGWTLSDTFSKVAENEQTRRQFVKSCLDFCDQYHFDGIDLDWEFPGFAEHSGRPEDKQNFTLLLEELHQAAKAHEPPLLVTIAAPAGTNHYYNIEVHAIHPYLDWINLMTYDFHGPWKGEEDNVTNHLAPLYPTTKGNPFFNVDSAVTYYISQGVPPEKIIVGMPFYGRSYAGVTETADGLHSSYTRGGTGTTSEVGMRFYYDIKRNLLPTYNKYWDDQAKVPYIYNPQSQEYVTYDDEQSITLKSQYVKEKGLGGAMVWELGLDTRPEWELLKAINQVLK